MSQAKDNIYRHEQSPADFVFDDKVAAVFSDMISRSVPGYATIVSMIGVLTERYAQENSCCYDLGCSLGAATLAMRHHLGMKNCRIIAIDNSVAMVERCRQVLAEDTAVAPVELICGDIRDVEIVNASVVVLNFTLQFIKPEDRLALLQKIHAGLLPGGMLILSEKICFRDPALDALFIEMHHRFKRLNGYSELEVSRKRAAIEKVLIPETIAEHESRIAQLGFSSFDVWFQCFNFVSMVAVKQGQQDRQ
ncbi:MAG: carboxy-S-adenosyl-L-methionine synthase CmoA [Pseudomonadales bacterium]|nr:carboxy-S-adenosyl-L-methionine synthase CmoA [Pseudomonadales bacterium]